MMNIYAVRCVSGTNDPKISWKKDDWVGTSSGNPTSELDKAVFFKKKNAIRRKDSLELLGCKFKLVEFALVETK